MARRSPPDTSFFTLKRPRTFVSPRESCSARDVKTSAFARFSEWLDFATVSVSSSINHWFEKWTLLDAIQTNRVPLAQILRMIRARRNPGGAFRIHPYPAICRPRRDLHLVLMVP
jgi:hypothetical protein